MAKLVLSVCKHRSIQVKHPLPAEGAPLQEPGWLVPHSPAWWACWERQELTRLLQQVVVHTKEQVPHLSLLLVPGLAALICHPASQALGILC